MMHKASNSASRRSRASSTRSCQMPLPSRNGGSPKKAPIAVRRIVAFGSRPASMPSPNQGRNESTSESEDRSEEHTSELQSLMRNSYAVFCLKTKNKQNERKRNTKNTTIQRVQHDK